MATLSKILNAFWLRYGIGNMMLNGETQNYFSLRSEKIVGMAVSPLLFKINIEF